MAIGIIMSLTCTVLKRTITELNENKNIHDNCEMLSTTAPTGDSGCWTQLPTSDKFHPQFHAVQSLQRMSSAPTVLQDTTQQILIITTFN